MSQGWGQGGNQGWGQGGNQGWGQGGNNNQGWGQGGNNNQGWGQGQQHHQGGQQGWGQGGHQGGQQQGWQQQQGWGQGGQQQQNWGQGGQGGSNTNSLFNPNRDYLIITALSDKLALDVSGNPQSKGKMIIWKKHGENNQLFRFRHQGGNRYQIISKMGTAVEVPGNSSAKGVQIHTSGLNNSPNEFW